MRLICIGYCLLIVSLGFHGDFCLQLKELKPTMLTASSTTEGTKEIAMRTIYDETSDEETSDEDTSDEDTSDDDTSDEETSDEETSDEETSDEETSEDETSEDETSDESSSEEGVTEVNINAMFTETHHSHDEFGTPKKTTTKISTAYNSHNGKEHSESEFKIIPNDDSSSIWEFTNHNENVEINSQTSDGDSRYI